MEKFIDKAEIELRELTEHVEDTANKFVKCMRFYKYTPLVLPPEKLDLWTEADKENYDIWKGEHQSIKNTEEDYRLFIIQLNKDYNIEEIYDHIETGLSALERLVEISKKFPGFDVENEIENTYAKDNMLEKDFVKSGFKLVLNYYGNSGQLSQVTPIQIYSADDEKMTKTQVDSSNTQHRTPVVKEEVVEECEKTLTRNKSKNKKKRNKESRQKRLLKFHEKLVTASGLPPSRLMEKQKLKRSLVDEFEQIGGVYDPGSDARPSFMHPAQPSHNITPAPVSLPPAAPSIEAKPRVTEPGIPAAVEVVQGEGEGQWHDGTGMSSGNRIFSTLSSGLPSAGLSPGWSDARPFAQCGCGLTNYQPQGMFTGVSSGFTNPLSLCSGPQSCVSWSPPVNCPKTLPAISSVSMPAYCYGCLQFGRVYNMC